MYYLNSVLQFNATPFGLYKKEADQNQFSQGHTPYSNTNNPQGGSFGGPQFGFENQKRGGMRGWLNRYGSSVILPIIALLILAGGIYLYANQNSKETETPNSEEQNQEKTNDTGFKIKEDLNPIADNQSSSGEEEEITEIAPAGKIEGNAIVEKAIRGDGVTHLARRALSDYLKDNPQSNLTNEHKIFIEDYLKDKTGKGPLEVNQEVSFSKDLIKEAIDSSLTLSANQLKNLEKYSSQVKW